MTSGPVLCGSCGARSPGRLARFCAACGAELPRTVEAAPAPALAAPPDRVARFRALRAHPDFAAAEHRVPTNAEEDANPLGHVLSAAVILCVGFILLVPSLAFPPVAVAVAVVVGLALLYVVASAVKSGARRRAPVVRVPACVAGERTELAGGGGGVRARYYLSLESERGTREEYEIDGRLAGKVGPGDLGIATFKGEALVDFELFAV